MEDEPATPLVAKLRSRIVPQDLRVSAKDLTNNHLVMMLYHAIAIDPRLLPKEYRVNGYVRVNGEKMSKSLGNFVTVEQALEKYPRHALLVALLEAGDGTNDANVRLADIPCIEKALQYALEIFNGAKEGGTEAEKEEDSKAYLAQLQVCWTISLEAASKGRNREALSYGWRKAAKSYDKHGGKPHTTLLDRVCGSIIRLTLQPIIGCETLMTAEDVEAFFSHNNVKEHDGKLTEFLLKMGKQIGDSQPLSVSINHVVLSHDGHRERVLEYLKCQGLEDTTVITDHTEIHPKRDPYKIKPVLRYS
jgi:leucyl-tRNA synthetase